MQTTQTPSKDVSQPFIDLFEPDTYHLPTEMYAKRLVNTPVEFGTLSLLTPADDDHPDHGDQAHEGQAFWGYDIDLAMHPHHGLLVCTAVGAAAGEHFGAELDSAIETGRDWRSVLVDALAESPDLGHHQVSPGIFITLMNANRSDIPDAVDTDGISFCSADDMPDLPEHMTAAMDAAAADQAEQSFRSFGARVVAAVRALGDRGQAAYKSGLEWLVTFQCI